MCLKLRTGLSVGLLALAVSSLSGRAQTCTVNWTNVYQRIDGFGASSAWQGNWTTKEADLFFSTNNGIVYTNSAGTVTTNNGIGLSLLRNHISYASSTSSNAIPSTSEISIMQYAQARGALVWSTPWTPAVGFKNTTGSGGGGVDGGSYNGSGNNITNLNYASQLANYVYSMEHSPNNVNIYAISVQNEPDANVTSYEACKWTGAQIHDFVTNLYTALVAKGVGSTKIIIPESQNWSANTGLYTPTLNDANAAADVSIIADHNYDGCPPSGTPAQLSTSGKSLWETEVAKLSCAGAFDGSITDGIYWAGRIHLFMTAAQANAWHYWWLVSQNSDNEGLTDNSSPTIPVLAKRMFVLGQWSRFVRPGYYRIDASTTGSALISAYNYTSSSNFAIVAVNPNTSTAISQTFNLTNFPTVSSVTPWITSATMSLSNQTPVTVSGSSFTYTLPALSVVTFVGQGVPNSAPVTTTVGLTASSNPSTYGNAVTFTATVRTNGVAVGGISGETVTFYDGGTQLGTGTVNGSGQAAYATSATQLSAVTHSITAGYGGDAVYAGSTNSPALSQTVNQATLTAGLTGTVSKPYDGTTTATLAAGNYTLPGVVSGDTVTLNNPASGTYDTWNQGTGKTVTVTGLAISGASATNYTLSSSSTSGAMGTISAATLTYTANPANMIYGSAVPGLSGSVGGFVGSDTPASATTGTLAFTTPATSSSSVGLYAINGSGLTANNGNYTFVQAAGNVTALSLLPLVTPAFVGPGISVGSGGWQLSFSAQAGQSYQVLATGDLTLPVNQWTVLTNGIFGAGTVTITDSSATNLQRFYQIVSP